MRKSDINKDDIVLLRSGFKAKVRSIKARNIIVFNGVRLIPVHHSDILRKLKDDINEEKL